MDESSNQQPDILQSNDKILPEASQSNEKIDNALTFEKKAEASLIVENLEDPQNNSVKKEEEEKNVFFSSHNLNKIEKSSNENNFPHDEELIIQNLDLFDDGGHENFPKTDQNLEGASNLQKLTIIMNKPKSEKELIFNEPFETKKNEELFVENLDQVESGKNPETFGKKKAKSQ